MESKEAIRARLRAASENLTRHADAYRALEHRDFDRVYPLVMGYIRDRFLLTREMCQSDKLLDLADVSLRYMLEFRRMGIDPGEISRSCSGASSVITKKVLLMKAVQEVFEVTLEGFTETDKGFSADMPAGPGTHHFEATYTEGGIHVVGTVIMEGNPVGTYEADMKQVDSDVLPEDPEGPSGGPPQ